MLKLFSQLVRFAGIGFLNTAVDFAVLNLLAAGFGVYTGLGVGLVNVVSFTIAVLHSYFWNKYWAFGSRGTDVSLGRNVGQFAAAALLGVLIIAAAIFGADQKLPVVYFAGLLVLLAGGEIGLWKGFRLSPDPLAQKSPKEFMLFIVVSIIGTIINSGIVAGGTSVLEPQFGLSQELWTNLVKAAATGISLFWNFLGYKLLVFKI